MTYYEAYKQVENRFVCQKREADRLLQKLGDCEGVLKKLLAGERLTDDLVTLMVVAVDDIHTKLVAMVRESEAEYSEALTKLLK